jgi:SAM-dependent methyltransferase
MIEGVIAVHLGAAPVGRRVLDIGCGNGDISRHFAVSNTVTGVDVSDRRRHRSGFDFVLVDSAVLPMRDASFDIVISNHVIEHIPDQPEHLAEIRRVLVPGGVAYLATPNRTSPLMGGHVGNPHVLRWRAMAMLFLEHGLVPTEYSVDVLSDPARFNSSMRHVRWVPRPVLCLLRPLFPSHIFILEPAAPA